MGFSTVAVSDTTATGIHSYTTETGRDNQYATRLREDCTDKYGFIQICTWIGSYWTDSSTNIQVGRVDTQIIMGVIMLEIIFITLLHIVSLYYLYRFTLYNENIHKANTCLDFASFPVFLSIIITLILWLFYDHTILVPSIVISLALLGIIFWKHKEVPREDEEVAAH